MFSPLEGLYDNNSASRGRRCRELLNNFWAPLCEFWKTVFENASFGIPASDGSPFFLSSLFLSDFVLFILT